MKLEQKTGVHKHFVIVGAGPVGLWTAIQLKKRMPLANVVLFEKHRVYQRKHVLRIQHSSLFFGTTKLRSHLDDKFFHDVFNTARATLKATPLSKSYISTEVIERNLKEWCLSLGCSIEYKEIESLSELYQRFDQGTQFILANGAGSNLRYELLGSNHLVSQDLQHIIELKSSIDCEIHPLAEKNVNGAIKGGMHNLAFEYIGRPVNGLTPVSLRLFISTDDYHNLPAATFKNPLTSPDELPLTIRNDLEVYAKLHDISMSTLFERGFISKLQLSVYAAKKFAELHKARPVYLVGDAAMGVPYFRALNSGFVLASRLAYLLSIKSNKPAIDIYNNYGKIHYNAEFALATGKNALINTYDDFRILYRKLTHLA